VEAEGWSKTSIEKMRKLDSFFKESHRVHGSPAGEVSCVENSNDESRTLKFSFLSFFSSHGSKTGGEQLFFL